MWDHFSAMDPHIGQETKVAQPHAGLGPYSLNPNDIQRARIATENYRRFAGKEPWEQSTFSTRDQLDARNGISLDMQLLPHRLLVTLIDLPIVQRLKDIYQIGGAEFVYKEAGHRRFDHAVGTGHLALQALDNMRRHAGRAALSGINRYELPVTAAAVLHDVGHVAPRSHMAEKIWFPKESGSHENTALRILEEDEGLRHVLDGIDPKQHDLHDLVLKVLTRHESVPPWTWKLIAGGGWNVDRGDWTYRDSVHCGVNYGKWDIAPLLKKLVISEDGELCVPPGGLPQIEHFFKRRTEMYAFVYHHDVSRVAKAMYGKLVQRARELSQAGRLEPADDVMQAIVRAERSSEMPVGLLIKATDSWWQSHVQAWMESRDPILSDLSQRIVFRRPFKHFPDDAYHREQLGKLIDQAGLDRNYYLLEIPKVPSKHREDLATGIRVLGPDGKSQSLEGHSGLLKALGENGDLAPARLAIPVEPFDHLRAS